MATKVETFRCGDKARNRAGKAKYDWDLWLDGSKWQLVKGEDFTLELKVFVGCIWTAAKARGLKVETHTYPKEGAEGIIELQAYKPEAEPIVPTPDIVDLDALAIADATVEPTITVSEPTTPEPTTEPVAPVLNSKQRAKAKKAAARALALAEQNGVAETV